MTFPTPLPDHGIVATTYPTLRVARRVSRYIAIPDDVLLAIADPKQAPPMSDAEAARMFCLDWHKKMRTEARIAGVSPYAVLTVSIAITGAANPGVAVPVLLIGPDRMVRTVIAIAEKHTPAVTVDISAITLSDSVADKLGVLRGSTVAEAEAQLDGRSNG